MTKKPTPPAAHQSPLELKRQLQSVTEALQRERADAINIRRQHETQISNLRTVVKADVIRQLLPVIDNFERALKHTPEFRHPELVSATHDNSDGVLKQVQDDVKKYQDFVKGVQAVVAQFEKTLADLGVERIKTVGEAFDPKYHEAVSLEEGDSGHEVVSEELQAGYKLGGDVIRHAMVKVRG